MLLHYSIFQNPNPPPSLLGYIKHRDSIRKNIYSLCGQCFKQHSQTSFNSLSDLIPPGIFQSFFKSPLLVMTRYGLHNRLRKCYFSVHSYLAACLTSLRKFGCKKVENRTYLATFYCFETDAVATTLHHRHIIDRLSIHK